MVECTLEPRSTGLWLCKTTNKNGLVTFRGDGIFTWHEADQWYTLSWFDPMGVLPNIFRGNIERNILTLTSRGPQRYTRTFLDFTGEKRHQFRMEVSQDGKEWHTFTEGTYERKD